MNKIYDQIIEYEKLFAQLAADQFAATDDVVRSNVKTYLSNCGAEIRRIISTTNQLIDQHITPFLKDPTSIDPQRALDLEEFAEKLSGYKESVDSGLSYDIRHALTEYAKLIGDDAMFIRNMFFKGLALFYLETRLFKEEMSACYEAVTAYSDRYTEFDRDTRNLIARAYGNLYISVPNYDLDEMYKRYDNAYNFWTNIAQKHDPDFAWSSFFYNLNENMCSSTVSVLRSSKDIVVREEYKKRFLQAAREINDSSSKVYSNDYTSLEIKKLYFLNSAEYYNNIITAKELLDFLFDVYSQADNEHNYDNLYKKLHVSALYIHYLQFVSDDEMSPQLKAEISKVIEQDVFAFATSIPDNFARAHVTTLLTNFAVSSKDIHDDFAYIKLLLSLTVFRHPPTYAHSVMVAKISYTIVEHLAQHHPEFFVGLPCIEKVEDVTTKLRDLLVYVWFSSLLHDIGKIVYSHLVSFYVRRLNDKEFEMIKQHSTRASSFIRTTNDVEIDRILFETLQGAVHTEALGSPELFTHFHDVALGHHKSYDGKFGYPSDFDNLASPVKPLIDIVTIADTIDAATDSVGRSYAKEKSLEELRDDMLSQIHTRYCPFVTNLVFEDSVLFDKIQDILQNYRFDVYYACLSKTDLGVTMMPPTDPQKA